MAVTKDLKGTDLDGFAHRVAYQAIDAAEAANPAARYASDLEAANEIDRLAGLPHVTKTAYREMISAADLLRQIMILTSSG